MKKKMITLAAAAAISMMSFATAQAEDSVIVPIKRLSMEMAQQIAQAAVEACRKEGVQVAATVVDRGGHPQAVLRDVLAMDLTLTISRQKAYTALSFNSPTSALEDRFEGAYAVPKIDGLVISAGGLPITAGGTILGGVGVSGAPSGETDEKCAQTGIDAVSDDLEMSAF
ncbi:MAG: heme-binding protein [Pseudomonadota bacterium]